MTFTILFVCSANVCRSPTALALFNRHVVGNGEAGHIVLRAAGFEARAGTPGCRDAVSWLRRHGVDPQTVEEHRSVLLDEGLIKEADLILTTDRSGTARVRRLRIDSRTRTFTLPEAAALSSYVLRNRGNGGVEVLDSPGLSDLVQEMDACRGLAERIDRPARKSRGRTGEDGRWQDIPDAHTSSWRVSHRVVLSQVSDSVNRLAEAAMTSRTQA